MRAFSPSDAALEGFRLTKNHPGVMLAWSAVYFGGILLIVLAMTAMLGPEFIALARKGGLASGDLDTVSGMLAQSLPGFLVVLAMSAFLLSIIIAGVLRLALRPEEHGFAHLRIGRDELRLTAANLLCVAIYVASAIVGVVLAGAARQAGPGAAAVAGALILGFAVWLGVRLSLLLPTVFETGRISLADAWARSRGHFWSLLGMILLSVIFYLVVWVLFSVVSIAVVELSGGEAAMQDIGRLTPITAIAAMVTLILQLLLQILQIVMIYGPFAVAYRQIRDEGGAP